MSVIDQLIKQSELGKGFLREKLPQQASSQRITRLILDNLFQDQTLKNLNVRLVARFLSDFVS